MQKKEEEEGWGCVGGGGDDFNMVQRQANRICYSSKALKQICPSSDALSSPHGK